MANGSRTAKSRQDLISAKKARRTTTRRRLITWGWIVAGGLPVFLQTMQNTLAQAPLPSAVANQHPDSGQKITIVPPVARAIAVEELNQPGAVIQTSGGLLGNLFSSDTGSSKEKDDGRKAYPLPPPDPSTVNWAGVPYHAPKPGNAATSDAKNSQPIRDSQSSGLASRPSQTPTATRPSTTASSVSAPRPTTAARPQSIPTSDLPSLPVQPSAPEPTAAPRVASAAPLPSSRLQPASPQSELSTSSSSRRSNRRQIDPLDPSEIQGNEAPSRSSASNTTFPPVGKRELGTTVPPSLAESAPTQSPMAAAEPESRVATAPPAAVENKSLEKKTDVEPEITPDPVSRTQPLSPAEDAKAYPSNTIAGQLSPLRPVESEKEAAELSTKDSSTGDSDDSDAGDTFYGSGVVGSTAPAEMRQTPGPSQPDLQSTPDANAATPSTGAANAIVNRSVAKPAPTAGKVVVASEIPGIRVITEGPSEILIRELTQYEVRVENRGSIDATGVIVRTELPAWAEVTGHNTSIGAITPLEESDGQVEWIIESLPAGVVERLFIRIKAVKPGAFDVATNWTSLPQTHSAKVMVREPKLSLEIEGPDEIIYGQSQKYRVRVMNPGDGVASNVVFTLAPGAEDAVQQPIGNIPAGKEASFEIELTARDQGELKIQGSANGDLELNAVVNKPVKVASAQIDATLAGPALKYQDTDGIYQLSVTNTGRAISESIAAELRLPAGVEYVGGIDSARVDGDRLIWNIKSLSPGETLDYEFTCKMARTGNHQLTFNCNGTAAGSASVGLETVVEAIADLKLAVFDPPAPATVGAEVIYEVVINNRGSKAAENVRCVAQFGHGIEPVRVDGHAGDVVTGQVLFAPIARIEAGAQMRLKIVARADKPGDHRFRAEVRSGETVLVAEEATVYVPARNERVSRSSSDAVNR